MVQFNFAERTIKAKVVYYGPPQSGKTTNLEQIHRLTDPTGLSRLVSLNTAQDRTLFFDLLPFSLGSVAGFDFKLQLYTVPGQVQYNATRRVVLSNADAVVFVADSRRSMMKENQASFENMKVNLLANRLVPENVPLVLQYNKRDLPEAAGLAELEEALNPWARPSFPAVASNAQGVLEVFTAVVQQMLTAIALKYNLREKGLDPAAIPGIVSEAFAGVLREAAQVMPLPAGTAPSPGRLVISPPEPTTEAGGLVSEELLLRAILSNAELAEALSGITREMSQGLATILSHAEMILLYREEAQDKRAAAVHRIQEEATRLRQLMLELGRTGLPTPGGARAPASALQESPPAPVPPSPSPAASAAGQGSALDAALRAVVSRLSASTRTGVAIELQVADGVPVPPEWVRGLEGALSTLIGAALAAAPPQSTLALHADRKPVVLRSREGEQRRDFVVLSLRPPAGSAPEEQARIAAGDGAVLDGSARRVRELGGFIRFATLPGGAVEMRVFLPTR